MYWNYGWGMGFGWIFMAIFRVLVIAGIVYLVKLVAVRSGKKQDTALDILKKRYAGGELTKEEFDRMRDDLIK